MFNFTVTIYALTIILFTFIYVDILLNADNV